MTKVKIDRRSLVKALRERDGDVCSYPGCEEIMDFKTKDLPHSATIDHSEPQGWCRANGWTEEEIWDLSNLTLMGKRCNADKGERRYNPDGTLPPKPQSRHARRAARGPRPEICGTCNAGRSLVEDEWCIDCGSGPQPFRYPKWRQMKVKECDHDLFFCVACTVWEPGLRRSVLDSLITGDMGTLDT